MARLNPSPIRMYRGTTEQHSQYAGPIGELTVDTDKNTVVVQNGTDGGVPLAQEKRQIIAGDGLKVNGGASGTLASDITVAADQTWLDSYIAGLVNGGNLVTAGDGVDVTASDGVAEIAVDDTVVRTSGGQTINGAKTFTSDIVVRNTYNDGSELDFVIPDVTKGTPPATTQFARVNVYDSSNPSGDISNAASKLGHFTIQYESDGDVVAQIMAVSPSSTSAATISVLYPASGSPYAVAPSTRAIPVDTEIVTFDFLENYVTENADNSVYLPLYFQVGTTEEIHTFLPAGVTTVRRANFEADGAGTDSLTLTMARDIGATTSMTVGSSATNCSAYAGHAVMFTISGTSDQTEVAAMLVFE